MGQQDFGRQFARFVDQQWGQHRRGWEGHGASSTSSWGGEWSGQRGSKGGPPPWVAGLFGLAQGDQGRGPRVRRGDVRSAILDVLRGEPMNGYQLINQIAERSAGAWKPSPGSVYPTLQQLEDEGLIEADAESGRRTFRLTADGERYVDENAGELAEVWAPFEARAGRSERRGAHRLRLPEARDRAGHERRLADHLHRHRSGSVAKRSEVLVETRRKLYGILAEGDAE